MKKERLKKQKKSLQALIRKIDKILRQITEKKIDEDLKKTFNILAILDSIAETGKIEEKFPQNIQKLEKIQKILLDYIDSLRNSGKEIGSLQDQLEGLKKKLQFHLTKTEEEDYPKRKQNIYPEIENDINVVDRIDSQLKEIKEKEKKNLENICPDMTSFVNDLYYLFLSGTNFEKMREDIEKMKEDFSKKKQEKRNLLEKINSFYGTEQREEIQILEDSLRYIFTMEPDNDIEVANLSEDINIAYDKYNFEIEQNENKKEVVNYLVDRYRKNKTKFL